MKHRLVAMHMGHGEAEFVLEAENSAKAFAKWKQVVANPRQWSVRSNTAMDSSSLLTLTQTSIKENDDNDDANADRTSPTDVELQDA